MSALSNENSAMKSTASTRRSLWQRFINPQTVADKSEQRQMRLLIGLLFVSFIIFAAIVVFILVTSGFKIQSGVMLLAAITLITGAATILARTRHYRKVANVSLWAFSLFILISPIGRVINHETILSSMIWLVIPILMGSAFLTLREQIALSAAVMVVFIVTEILYKTEILVVVEIAAFLGLVASVLLALMRHRDHIEADRLMLLSESTSQLQTLNTSLEAHVAERTRDLALAVEVGQRIASERNFDSLLPTAVELIRSHYDLYYVQIYLADAAKTKLTLKAGSGEVGKVLVRRGHALPVSPGSINGMAAVLKKTQTVSDTRQNDTFLPNLLLPETRSEMAVPLLVGEELKGVLNIQSSEPGFLTESSAAIFETVASQLSIAIQNAALFQEVSQARAEIEERTRQLERQGWNDFLDGESLPRQIQYSYSEDAAESTSSELRTGNSHQKSISIHGQSIGSIQLEFEDNRSQNDADDFAEVIARQVAQRVENLRLLHQANQYQNEAIQASRRLTREGWEEYFSAQQNAQTGYLFDQVNILKLNADPESAAKVEGAVALPIKVRGESIGELLLDPAEELDQPEIEFVEDIAERLGAYIENLRLSEQTQEALFNTEKLYSASRSITSSQDEMETARNLVDNLDHTGLDRIILSLKISEDPVIAEVVAAWDRDGMEARILGNRFTDQQLPLISQVQPGEVVLVDDLDNAPHIDPVTCQTFKRLRVQSVAIVPVAAGDKMLGSLLFMTTHTTRKFNEETVETFLTLAGHAATVIQNQRLVRDLRLNEDRLSEALDIARLGHWEYDVEEDRFTFNDHFYSIFHATAEQAGGYRLSSAEYAQKFVHPQDMAVVGSEIGKALNATDRLYSTSLEHRIVYADGGMGYISVKLNVERDENGRIIRFYGASQDITERKRNEEALQTSKTQLADAMSLARLGNWEYDLEKDIFTFNDAFYALFRTTAQEVGGYQLSAAEYASRFVHPDDVAMVAAVIGRTYASTEPVFTSSIEHRILFPDKSTGYMLVNIRAERDENGMLTHSHGTNQDITERKLAEENLLRLQSAVEQTDDGIALADLHGNLLYSNPAWARMHGYTPEEIPGNYLSIFHTEEQLEREVMPFNEKVMALGSNTAEIGHKRKDGTTFPALMSVSIHRDRDGKPMGMIGTARDITERKQAEQALRASEARYSAVLTQASDGAVLIQDNIIKYVNTAMADLLGYTPEEMVGQSMSNFIAPESRALIVKRVQDRLAGKDVPSLYEAKLLRRNQTSVDVELSAGVIEYLGQPADFGFARDITDRKRSQELITRRAKELETVATVSTTTSKVLEPDTLLQSVVDLTKQRFNLYHAHIYTLNEAGNSLILTAGADEVGRQMTQAGHAIPLNAEVSLVARSAREQKPAIVNNVRSEAGFLPNPMLPETRSEMAVPMIVGDRVLGVFDVQSNEVDHFTEADANIYSTLAAQVAVALQNARSFNEVQQTAVRLQDVDRLKNEFLANMSHELRTPLNSIIGYSEILLTGIDGELDEEKRADVQAIFDNGKHLLELINDVLDLAKIEAGRMTLKMDVVDIHKILEKARSNSIGVIHALEKPLNLSVEADPQLPNILVDSVRISQVLNNLLSNAIKFSEKGSITVRAFQGEGLLSIEVEDEGIGISEEDLGKLFERFSQVDSSARRRATGTGLGLHISYRLMELHGGSLSVRSELGRGSVFTMQLPLDRVLVQQ